MKNYLSLVEYSTAWYIAVDADGANITGTVAIVLLIVVLLVLLFIDVATWSMHLYFLKENLQDALLNVKECVHGVQPSSKSDPSRMDRYKYSSFRLNNAPHTTFKYSNNTRVGSTCSANPAGSSLLNSGRGWSNEVPSTTLPLVRITGPIPNS